MKALKILFLLLLCSPLIKAQDAHSLKLGYLATHGPAHFISIGYEGEIAPRFSFAPTIGFTGANQGYSDGLTTLKVTSFSQVTILPIRYYPWYSQPKIKAGPFVSTHLRYGSGTTEATEFETGFPVHVVQINTHYLGWGIGTGWTGGIGRFRLEGFFNFSALGGQFGKINITDSEPESVGFRYFPVLNFAGGVAVGMRL